MDESASPDRAGFPVPSPGGKDGGFGPVPDPRPVGKLGGFEPVFEPEPEPSPWGNLGSLGASSPGGSGGPEAIAAEAVKPRHTAPTIRLGNLRNTVMTGLVSS